MKNSTLILLVILISPIFSFGQFWNFSTPEKLSGNINTEAEESIPVFSKDSSLLFFVRTFDSSNRGDENDQDIWFSERTSEFTYDNAKALTDLNNKFNNAIVGLSTKGDKMYLLNSYDGKKDLIKGISVSEFKNGKWNEPMPIVVPGLDIDGDFYGFHVSKDEKVMIISYEGPNSMGQEDLYVSLKENEGWSAPIHMGGNLNSSGFEISPFLSQNNDTLFFSSNGFGGEGDADIFYSVKQTNWSDWSRPINLGNVINSPKFDAYFIHSGKQAFWSTNRESDKSDIWMLNILTPPSLVAQCNKTDITQFGAKDGAIEVVVESGVSPISYSWSNNSTLSKVEGLSKGEYSVDLTDGVGQMLTLTCSIDEPKAPVVLFQDFELLHNFGYNKNQLTTKDGELKAYVDSIQNQLNKGRLFVKIDIHSSASMVPTKTFKTNEELASKRAENIKLTLENHFKGIGLSDKVEVNIVKVEVQGPQYENDSSNRKKYEPFQFISLKSH
jgi:hypothetical protein